MSLRILGYLNLGKPKRLKNSVVNLKSWDTYIETRSTMSTRTSTPATEHGSAEIEQLQGLFGAVAEVLGEFEERGEMLEDVTAVADENREDLEDVFGALETLLYNQRAIEHEVEAQRDDTLELDKKVDDLEEEVDARLEKLEERVGKVEKQLDAVSDKVATNADDIQGIRNDIEDVQSLFSDRVLDKERAHNEAKKRDPEEVVERGDTHEVVITDTEYDKHDPVAVAKIDGLVTFVHVDNRDIDEGDSVTVKITDLGDNCAQAVPVGGEC